MWTESTGTDESRETAVQSDSGRDHQYTAHKKGSCSSDRASTPSFVGDKTNSRARRLVPTLDGTQALAPRNGREHAKVERLVKRTRAALHQADANIDADTFLHRLFLGIMLPGSAS